MSQRNIDWLLGELEGLVQAGVLSSDVADRLRAHYGGVPRSRGALPVLLGVIGALLVGLGVILLIAHNWSELGRPARTVMAFLPLLVGQILGWQVLAKRIGSAWREAIAMFWALSIGAAIAIVGQTYHLPGDMPSFLFSWLVLGLPIVYVLNSAGAAVLYAAGMTGWGIDAGIDARSVLPFWALLAAILPWWVNRVRRDDAGHGTRIAHFFLVVSVAVSFAFVLDVWAMRGWIYCFAALFALLYATDAFRHSAVPHAARAGHVIGVLGVLVVATSLTIRESWGPMSMTPRYDEAWRTWIDQSIVWVAMLAPAWLVWRRRDEVEPHQVMIALFPGWLGVLSLLAMVTRQHVPTHLSLNVYLLVLGILALRTGSRNGSLGTLNLGLTAVSILIVTRFFDTDLPFLVRGLAFIALGLGFIWTNLRLLRRRKGAAS